MSRIAWRAAALLILVSYGCRADREVFEEGATFETPPEIREAPATPIPPQPFELGATPSDTVLPPLDPDRREHAAPGSLRDSSTSLAAAGPMAPELHTAHGLWNLSRLPVPRE